MYLISFVNAEKEEFNTEFNTFEEAQSFWDAEADKYIFGRMEDLSNNEIIWAFSEFWELKNSQFFLSFFASFAWQTVPHLV